MDATVGGSLHALAPELILAGGATLLLLLDLIKPATARTWLLFAVAVTIAALRSVSGDADPLPFGGRLSLDGVAFGARVLVLAAAAAALLVSIPHVAARPQPTAEYPALILFAAAGLSGMAAARHWIVLFIFLEMASLSFAALLGARREDPKAREAALKYFLLGAFASAFLLYGIAWRFTTTGSLLIGAGGAWEASDALALALIGAGLAFKCALVPFHMWAPDVYQGGPAPVIGFMASASKAVGFLVLGRVLLGAGALAVPGAATTLAWIAGASIVTGTFLALVQRDVKRMLAYSGIAHAGYAALALLGGTPGGPAALLTYLAVYAVMTTGAFAALSALEAAGGTADLEGVTGLGKRAPGLALALAVCLVSLTGLPPTAGFIGKFAVFREALAAGWTKLVLLAVVMSVVSVGFYLRLLVPMYFEKTEDDAPRWTLAPEGLLVAALLAVLLLAGGLLPARLLAFGALAGG